MNEPADINLIGALLIFQMAMYAVFGLIVFKIAIIDCEEQIWWFK